MAMLVLLAFLQIKVPDAAQIIGPHSASAMQPIRSRIPTHSAPARKAGARAIPSDRAD